MTVRVIGGGVSEVQCVVGWHISPYLLLSGLFQFNTLMD